MKLAESYAKCTIEEVKAALAGAVLRVYSCPQPEKPEKPVLRNGFLAEFALATPAFEGDVIKPVESPVPGKDVGVPLFVRATQADGTPIADFSAGPGDMDVKLASVSCSVGAPVAITKFQIRLGVANPSRPLSPRDRMKESD
ncbi:hypothetical protein [Methylovirgula sp. HY1]|uniref:hypothetical protein n=1 Tax=Methylovirgula sp. HY1 TaxID=2822761 RepID=UPI001C5ABAE3|nr:hypothetical protein [Methylovirgula sp. HY1]QXX74995.1 hypothetical protein MHY1_01812 [Methylovirgula sp. HY1]